MAADNKSRLICVLKFLLDNTDEEHPATIAGIISHLSDLGIEASRKTIADDIVQLQECGFDIICNKSRQNRYFIGMRSLEIHELKMLVDAVQAARFITQKKTDALIEKLTALASPHQANELNRQLYVDSSVKATNESVFYIVDLIYSAINSNKQITFQYYEYSANKKKTLKHRGKHYVFSPYRLVWCNDSYYVFGFSESHGKVIKFRIDRIYKPELLDVDSVEKPSDFDIADYCKKAFSLFDAETERVELLCRNETMKAVIDKFGDSVETRIRDCNSFMATVEASVSPTFFAWVFTYRGDISITAPEAVKNMYREHIDCVLKKLDA